MGQKLKKQTDNYYKEDPLIMAKNSFSMHNLYKNHQQKTHERFIYRQKVTWNCDLKRDISIVSYTD